MVTDCGKARMNCRAPCTSMSITTCLPVASTRSTSRPQRAVQVAVHLRRFGERAPLPLGEELRAGEEIVITSVALRPAAAPAWCTRPSSRGPAAAPAASWRSSSSRRRSAR